MPVPDAGVGVDHHAHVDVVQHTQAQVFLLAAEEADLPLLTQPFPVLQLHVLLRRHRHEGHIAVQLVRQRRKTHGRAQHGGDLGVVTAGVGGAGGPVRLGVEGADHGVQLAHHHDPGTVAAALQIAPDAGDGQLIPVGDPQTFKRAAHQCGGIVFFKAQFRMGENLLSDVDDGSLVVLDQLQTAGFECFLCHIVSSFGLVLPIPAETDDSL